MFRRSSARPRRGMLLRFSWRAQRSAHRAVPNRTMWFLFHGLIAFAVHLDLRLAEKAISHTFLVRIPVPVIRVSLLFDTPKLIEQNGAGNRELETVAHEGVGPL